MFSAIRTVWRSWRRPPIDWTHLKTIEMKMMIAPNSVGQAMKELEAEKAKLFRARKRLKKSNRKTRR